MSEEQLSPRLSNVQIIGLSFAATLAIILLAAGIFMFLSADDEVPEPTLAPAADGVTVISPAQNLQDFTLVSNTGNPLSLSELQGKLVLMAFGYTHCPDVCPATLLEFRQVKADLGDAADDVAFVFISVDGQRDTPEVLNQYLQRYDPDFIGLSGADEVLEHIGPDYNLFYATRENTDSAAGYLVEHSATRFLIDEQGQLIRIYSFTTDANTIADDIRSVL